MDLQSISPPPPSPVPPGLLDEADTLTGALETLVRRYPDFEGLTLLTRDHQETRLSLSTLWNHARAVQTALVDGGFRPGDFAILAMPTGPTLVSAYFGTILAGGVPALCAPPSNRFAAAGAYAERLGAMVQHAGATVLLCDDEVAGLALDAGLSVRLLDPSRVPTPATPAAIVPARGDAVVTAQYSSGSTGTPKGVLLSHRAVLNNIRATRDGFALGPDDVTVNWLPLYHDLGLIDAVLLPMLSGTPAVLIPTMDFMRVPALWLRAIHHYRGTVSLAPNFAYTLAAQRIEDAELGGLDVAPWRIAFNGSEPCLSGTLEAFAARFARYGVRATAPVTGWGLAESVCIATVHPLGEPVRVEYVDRQALAGEGVARPGASDGLPLVSVGTALPGVEIAVRDPNGRRVPDRQVGTIWLRTTSLFQGYHRDPAATAATLVDGWLDTGDRGYCADDHLFFVARDKDLIVIGGEKYAPHDVEMAINRVPGVRAGCAVSFGVLDPDRGTEEIAAVVETRETEAAALDRLRTAIRTQVMESTGLGLKHIVLVPPGGVEKTTSGKLARRRTREKWAKELIP